MDYPRRVFISGSLALAMMGIASPPAGATPIERARQGTFRIVAYPEQKPILEKVGPTVAAAGERRVTLGSWTLTVAQTKQLANNMKTLSSLKVTVFLAAVGLKAPFAALAAALTVNATVRNDVIYAGSHGKRVRITITDSANHHTSYSTQVTYKVI